LRIVVINNYKEEVKANEAVHNLTRCVGRPLEMVDYKTHDLHDIISRKAPDALVLTGSNFMLSKKDTQMVFRPEMDLVRQLDLPIFGICFGHQLIGAAYGSEVIEMGQNVRAFKEVKLISKDLIFDGLPSTISVAESHRQTLSKLPKLFRHLAESSTSKFEVIAHESRPVYGLQFHPERSDEKHPHGEAIIRNFVKLIAKS
jgi:GMP synthase (glutamine-hydrolysing)